MENKDPIQVGTHYQFTVLVIVLAVCGAIYCWCNF